MHKKNNKKKRKYLFLRLIQTNGLARFVFLPTQFPVFCHDHHVGQKIVIEKDFSIHYLIYSYRTTQHFIFSLYSLSSGPTK